MTTHLQAPASSPPILRAERRPQKPTPTAHPAAGIIVSQGSPGGAPAVGRDLSADARPAPAVQRLDAYALLDLQRRAGNRAVVSGIATPPFLRNVQRRIKPEDLAGQMAGTAFQISQPQRIGVITLAVGDSVRVVAWDNAITTVQVEVLTPHVSASARIDVPKKALRSSSPKVSGIAHYDVGLAKVVGDYERGEKALTDERARKGGGRAAVVAELSRLQSNRERLLNKRLIQSSMLNRFDASIRRWVDHYNTLFDFDGRSGKIPLDPNHVKSMIFQESQMGTAGEHLEYPAEPDPKVKTRQNIGQMVDSSAAALLTMIKEEQPALVARHGIQNLERDSRAATDAEGFMWSDPGFIAAVTEFFATVPAGTPEKNVDYDFWVHAAIRWLFAKRKSRRSWAAAIRAYNGGGARADHYRDAVLARARDATRADKAGGAFVPKGL